jgi:predicted nucleic acid-binding protein
VIAVADTSPINYLVLTGCVQLLPDLFEEIIVPPAVFTELRSSHAPQTVQDFVCAAPKWLRVQAVEKEVLERVSNRFLHRGEREAIALAEFLAADYLIMDEKAGRGVAIRRQLTVIGTLGILDKADEEGLIDDFPRLLERLEEKSFRVSTQLRDALLGRHRERVRRIHDP